MSGVFQFDQASFESNMRMTDKPTNNTNFTVDYLGQAALDFNFLYRNADGIIRSNTTFHKMARIRTNAGKSELTISAPSLFIFQLNPIWLPKCDFINPMRHCVSFPLPSSGILVN